MTIKTLGKIVLMVQKVMIQNHKNVIELYKIFNFIITIYYWQSKTFNDIINNIIFKLRAIRITIKVIIIKDLLNPIYKRHIIAN